MLVVCPALNSPLRHWVSDEDGARARGAAAARRAASRELAAAGSTARGEIGDADPLQAIEDALRTLRRRRDRSSRRIPRAARTGSSSGVVQAARERFAVPITHVVVDLEAEAGSRA